MPEIIQCPSCKRKLQLPESLLNQDVQCPSCNATFLAQKSSPITGDSQAPPPLPPESRGYEERRPPRRDDDDDYEDDYERQRRRRRRDLAPHRGGMLLAFGIISIVACQIFGPIAWIMGNQDLEQIRSGHMDPEGEGLTQAGRILGIIGTVLLIFYILLVCLYIGFIFVIIGGAAAGGGFK